jgi:hypothetical protein
MIKRRFIHTEKTRHGKTVYYFRKGNAPRYRLPDEYGTKEFWREYQRALDGDIPQHPRQMKNLKGYRRMVALHECIRHGIHRAKMRAKAKGIDFDITVEWAIEQMKDSDYRCPVSGIPFDVKESVASFARPHAPSLDRINSKGGYTKDNVRVVTYAVNMAVADWGEEILAQVANGIKSNRHRKRTSIPALTSDLPAPPDKAL